MEMIDDGVGRGDGGERGGEDLCRRCRAGGAGWRAKGVGGGSSDTASLIFFLSRDIHGDYNLIVGGGDDDGSIESKNFKIYLSNFSC